MTYQVLSERPAEATSEETVQLVGQPLKRKEDPRILSGRTRYVDDIKLPNILHAAVLRSVYAHARIKSIDTSAARNYPGVRHIITFQDLPKESSYLPTMSMKDGTKIERALLAKDEVCYVGEPVVFVVADNRYQAEDAIELVNVDYDPLPAIADPEVGIMEGSAHSHEKIKTNIVLVDSVSFGEPDAAFEKAPKVIRVDLLNQRLAPAPMEPRASIASFDSSTQMLTVWISHQGPFQSRSDLAGLLKLGENHVRVFAPDVGGGFGAKISPYPEDVLVCLASMATGKPIKWIETRSENFLSMTHGRGQIQHVELASTEKGRILGSPDQTNWRCRCLSHGRLFRCHFHSAHEPRAIFHSGLQRGSVYRVNQQSATRRLQRSLSTRSDLSHRASCGCTCAGAGLGIQLK